MELRRLPRPDVYGRRDCNYFGNHNRPRSDRPARLSFRELICVYGTTCKDPICEEFGDGTMRAVDFDMTLERQPDQAGDRVKITLPVSFSHACRADGLKVQVGWRSSIMHYNSGRALLIR